MAAFALYMLPVLMTIVGFLVGSAVSGGSEDSPLPIVLAVAFLVVSFLAVWIFDLTIRKTERRDATVMKILSDEDEPSQINVVKFGG